MFGFTPQPLPSVLACHKNGLMMTLKVQRLWLIDWTWMFTGNALGVVKGGTLGVVEGTDRVKVVVVGIEVGIRAVIS
jgi:hypothetical protein